ARTARSHARGRPRRGRARRRVTQRRSTTAQHVARLNTTRAGQDARMSTLVAVYRDRGTAETVAHELESPDLHTTVRVDDPADAELSIAAQMDAQVQESWGTAAVGGFVTSEQMRGALVFAGALGALGAVVGVPFGWILFDASSSTLTKIGVGALV